MIPPWSTIKSEYIDPIVGILLSPLLLYREIKQQIDLWNTKGHTPFAGKGGEARELKALVDRLERYRDEASARRERLCQGIVAKLFADPSSAVALASRRLLSEILAYEGFLTVPDIDLTRRKLSTSELWEITGALVRVLDSFEKPDALEARLETLLRDIFLASDLFLREGKAAEEAIFQRRFTRFCLIQ